MSKRKFNDGQEILFEDLTAISDAAHKEIYKNLFFELIERKGTSFLNDGLLASRVDAGNISVKAGFGIHIAGGDYFPVILEEDFPIVLPAAGADRCDLLCVKGKRKTSVSDFRNFKPIDSDVFEQQEFVLEEDHDLDFVIVEGAGGVGVVPAAPAGYVALAEIIREAGDVEVKDVRAIMPLNRNIELTNVFSFIGGTSLSSVLSSIDSKLYQCGVSRSTFEIANNLVDHVIHTFNAELGKSYVIKASVFRTYDGVEYVAHFEIVVIFKESTDSWLEVKSIMDGEEMGVSLKADVDGSLKVSTTDEAGHACSCILKIERM